MEVCRSLVGLWGQTVRLETHVCHWAIVWPLASSLALSASMFSSAKQEWSWGLPHGVSELLARSPWEMLLLFWTAGLPAFGNENVLSCSWLECWQAYTLVTDMVTDLPIETRSWWGWGISCGLSKVVPCSGSLVISTGPQLGCCVNGGSWPPHLREDIK